ncbi:hypothetical protein Taro_051088 [Colocasia esculenta]|uniref:Uncharacterized protein n=1 Tax=Colocasia esculenta TaxID=4460 RepID=A0A843XFT1_COLES|nr:hypothetical protein [Colocasia esculenta]
MEVVGEVADSGTIALPNESLLNLAQVQFQVEVNDT